MPVGPPKFVYGNTTLELSDPKVLEWEDVPEGSIRVNFNGKRCRNHRGWRREWTINYEHLNATDYNKLKQVYHEIVTGTTVFLYPFSDAEESFEIDFEGSFPTAYFNDKYIAFTGKFKFISKGYVNLIETSSIGYIKTFSTGG